MFKILLIAILQSMTLASGIIVPFFMGYGATPGDIFLITAVYQISIFLLEIPTGLLASRYGEKSSILLGFLLSALYYLLLPYTDTLNQFLLLQGMLGCSVAFLSGSLNTFLKHYGENIGVSYMDIRKKYKIVTLMVGIFATVLGGLLSSYGYARIFQIQGLLFLVIIALLLPVPYNPQHEFVEKSYLQMIKKSVSVLRQKDIFLPTIFIYSFLAIEAGVYIGFQTQYVGELQLPKEYLGIGLGAFVLFAAIFTSYLPKQKRVLSKGFFVVIALCFIIPLLLNLIYPSMIALLLLYLTQVIRPMDIPVEDRILNTVTDNTGSTVLSFVGFYERIGFMIITVLVHVFGGSPILTLLILSMLLGISCLLFYKNSYSDT